MRSTYQTLDTVEYGAPTRRLKPSNRLTGRAREIFIETVSDCAITHFRASDRPLLELFAEACALAEQAVGQMAELSAVVDGKPSPWFSVFVARTKAANNLALRLRISPQSRSPRAPKTLATSQSYYDRMTLEDDDGDEEVDGGRP